jgi:hypothetical protein
VACRWEGWLGSVVSGRGWHEWGAPWPLLETILRQVRHLLESMSSSCCGVYALNRWAA